VGLFKKKQTEPEVLEESAAGVKIQEEIPVQTVTKAGDATILDFGQNFAGIIEIDPTKMTGHTLKLRHGEILSAPVIKCKKTPRKKCN